MKTTTKERDEAIDDLRKTLQPGDTVFAVIRHVSASGMYRAIDFYVFRPDDRSDHKVERNPYSLWLSYQIATATGFRFDKQYEAVGVRGCGMDMAFHVIHTLGRVLFPDGFKVNGYGRNGDTSGWDKDGGYALTSRILG